MPIPIYEVDGGDLGSRIGWYTDGHQDEGDFLAAVLVQELEEDGRVHGYNVEDVKQSYWRTVPIPGDDGVGQFVEASGPGRGAKAITYINEPSSWATRICYVHDCNNAAKSIMQPLTIRIGTIYVRFCKKHRQEFVDYEQELRAEALKAINI